MKTRLAGLCLLCALLVQAQASSSANSQSRQWFEDARFGMFIHWGVYATLADGEWVMNQRAIPAKDYERLAEFFNPVEFNAAEWVGLAKAAGMKYITITSKHHDGFAMWDSKVSDYDIVDRTPYKKDVLKALAEECKRQGIKLFFYHSQLDWHHPDYFPRGNTGRTTGRPEAGNWNRYIDYMDAQLKELLTGYGDIGGIWFDGWWDKPDAEWRLAQTYKMIHDLQPGALIGSNHHKKPFPGEDFQMFEKDLPGHNTAGFNEDSQIGTLPLETCDTMNNSWGYNLKDQSYKSTETLIRYLVRAAGYNANFLLNVGPMPNGKIQPEFVKTLREIGTWTEKYGESVYGTRGGPITPRHWGVTTRKGNRIYVHVLDWNDPVLALPPLNERIVSAKLLRDGSKVEFGAVANGLLVSVPQAQPGEYDRVIVLEVAGK